MTTRNILLAAVLAFSAFGCVDGEIIDRPDGGGYVEFCPDRRLICTGDTICMDMACQGAFDRDYRVRLGVFYPAGARECPDDRDCPTPLVEVFHGDGKHPILTSADPKVTEIHVTGDSWLTAVINGDECTIDLTTECLQRGSGSCTAGGVSATLKLDPMPSVAFDGEGR